MAIRPFEPKCLQCQYDLSGTPDGRCPECGAEFTVARLLAQAGRPSRWRFVVGVAIATAWTVAFFAMAFVLIEVAGETAASWATILWIACSFAWVFRRDLATNATSAFVILALYGLIWALSLRASSTTGSIMRLWYALPLVLICPAAFGIAWSTVSSRRRPALLNAWAGALIGCGGVVLVTAGLGIICNEHWSDWSDPRPGQLAMQYPLSNREAIWLGAGIVAVGVGILVASARLRQTP